MVAGMLNSIRGSAFVVWVAIAPVSVSLFIEKIEQRLRDGAGSLPAIFTHPRECGPVPGPQKGKNDETSQFEMANG
jgi:hypothetical protein